jgi:putative heme-binding domain-containing protein
LLLWWVFEALASEHVDAAVCLFDRETKGGTDLQTFLLERLARRYALGDERLQEFAGRLYEEARGSTLRRPILVGLEAAYDAAPQDGVSAGMLPIAEDLWNDGRADPATVRLLAKMGYFQARMKLVDALGDARLALADRRAAIRTVGQNAQTAALSILVKLLADDSAAALHLDLVAALRRFKDERIPPALLARMLESSGHLRTRCLEALAAKPPGAKTLLEAVDAGKLKPSEVPNDTLANILLFNDKAIAALVEKHWGQIKPMSLGEKTARVHGVKVSLKLAKGNASHGKALFAKHCGNCHRLFGEGAKIGPDLTGADRHSLDFLLTSIVDPSAVIRREYTAQTVVTADGQVLSGLVAEATPTQVVLIDSKAQKIPLRRGEIEEMKPSATSIMPEKLLDALSAQEVRDLVAYLQSQPPKR